MKLFNKTLIHDLYSRNRLEFHKWLFKTYSTFISSPLGWCLTMIIIIVSVLTLLIMSDNRSEITNTRYEIVINDQKKYAETIPQLKVLLVEAMTDTVITKNEYNEMRSLVYDYWDKSLQVSKSKTKTKLLKQLND